MQIANFFALNIRILKGAGVYPPQSHSRSKNALIWLFNCACVGYSMIYYTIAELASLKDSAANINDLVKNLNMSMSFILTFFKVAVWLWNYRELTAIMRALQTTAADGSKFARVGDFDPVAIITGEKRLKDRLTFTFFTLSFLVPTSACVASLAEAWSASAHAQNVAAQKLPYISYVPFDYRASWMNYCCAVVYQCAALLMCGMITVGFDMLFYSIVCFTSAHFKLLQGAFATIKEKALAKLGVTEDSIAADDANLQKVMYDEQRACIQHLQLILQICDKLESIFSLLTLLQLLVSQVVFCTCLFIIATIPIGSNIPGNEITYMLAIENQLAVYCYAGNKLTARAAEIPNAIYSGDWLTTSAHYRKNVLFTMMRMSKEVCLTAGGFTTMNLATFVTIGKGSYSLFAMLNSVE